MMLLLTENAKNRITEICNNKEFLRVFLESGGCHGFSYKFEVSSNLAEDDYTIKNQSGSVMIAIKKVFLEKINFATVDFIKNISSSYFILTSENFGSSCGCGTSFSIKV